MKRTIAICVLTLSSLSVVTAAAVGDDPPTGEVVDPAVDQTLVEEQDQSAQPLDGADGQQTTEVQLGDGVADDGEDPITDITTGRLPDVEQYKRDKKALEEERVADSRYAKAAAGATLVGSAITYFTPVGKIGAGTVTALAALGTLYFAGSYYGESQDYCQGYNFGQDCGWLFFHPYKTVEEIPYRGRVPLINLK